MNKKQFGFTIIELIVVIAIIAVLAGIVMVSVQGYVVKGKIALIRASMRTLMTNGPIYFNDNPGKFGVDFVHDNNVGFGLNSPIYKAVTETGKANPLNDEGSSSNQNWCAVVDTPAGGSWCVDSAGYAGTSAGCVSDHFTCLP